MERGAASPPRPRNRRRKDGGCYHCGAPDHRAKACPGVVCRRCWEWGHDAGACPLRPVEVELGEFRRGADQDDHCNFTYVELFCGMGGFRVALDALGGRCALASEIDRHCRDNYRANFGDRPAGDVCHIAASQIPEHDVLVGGFPCQPFSSSGGRRGLDDPRGQLFREIVRILRSKRPRAFLLENVRGLLLHDGGNTLRLILEELEGCNYDVQYQVVDAVSLLPQERKRLFLVGIRRDLLNENGRTYRFPTLPHLERGVQDILHRKGEEFGMDRLVLNPNQLQKVKGQRYTQQHPEARFLTDLSRPTKTLQSSYMQYMVGSQFVPCGEDRWRKFSAREAARLQGFPERFVLCPQRAHHMLGNAVAPPVIAMLAAPLIKCIGCHSAEEAEDGDWGWKVARTMLLEAAPNGLRREELERKLLDAR